MRFKEEAPGLIISAAAAIVIRAIPEALSHPYLIGYDTILYAGTIQRAKSCVDLLSSFSSPLLPVMLYPFGKIFGSAAVMKIYPPVTYGLLAVALFVFARKSLGLNRFESTFSTVFVLVQFGMLRLSWDLHRNILGLVFLLMLLSAVQGPVRRGQLVLNGILAVLVFLTHELTSLLLVGTLLILTLMQLIKREPARLRSLVPTAVVSILILSYMASAHSHRVPEMFAAYASPEMLLSVPVFFGFLYLPLLPFAILSYRASREQCAWLLTTAVAGFSPVFSPFAFALWDRWMLTMAPAIGLLGASGILRFARFAARKLLGPAQSHTPADLRSRIVSVLVLTLLFMPSVYLASGFMTYRSDRPFWYFDNPKLWRSVPATMLSNTLALRDVADMIRVISELDTIIERNDVVLAHDAFYGWLLLYLDERTNLIGFEYNAVDSAVISAKEQGFEGIYLLWFVPNRGWHEPDPDLSFFKEMFRSGIIVVYRHVG